MSKELSREELKELAVRGCARCYECETPSADCLNPYKECSICSVIRQLAIDVLQLIDTYTAQREQAAELRGRVDELYIFPVGEREKIRRDYISERRAKLQATNIKPEKEG